MKLFISWSGARSQTLAQALREWVPLVLHYVEPWLSETDVAAGERWVQAVAKELETSNFGVICVTRENVASPWILFEAGSLAKSLQGSRVIPLLLDLEFSEIGGPLAQFQAKKVDEAGIGEMIQSINAAATPAIAEPRLKHLFQALWPDLEKHLASIPKQAVSAKPIRPHQEILEELVAGIRSLESRLRNVEEMASGEAPGFRRMRRRFHPMMLHDLVGMIGLKPGDPTAILFLASMVRDDAPWLYELGMEAYRAAKGGRRRELAYAMERFHRAVELMMRGPFAEEFGMDPRSFHMVARELDHLLMAHEPSPDEEPRPTSKEKKEAGS